MINKTVKLMVSAFLIIAVIGSCKKDSTQLTASMSAKVNGAAWSTVVRVTTLQSGNFIITGTSLAGEIMTITILGNVPGTYTLSALPPTLQFSVTDEDVYTTTSVQVVISIVDATNMKLS
ncbi:MAG: DUF6252 family protein [Bacteroidia bacterium]|nr:DUF6252 family protein [Bacteroidia bacterium]